MDAERRERILRIYEAHAKRFDAIASRSRPAAAPVAPELEGENPPQVGDLTERELEVLALVARGYSNDETAARLGISMETVKTHLVHISQRLGARNRAHAVYLACARGVLSGLASDRG